MIASDHIYNFDIFNIYLNIVLKYQKYYKFNVEI